MKIGNLYEYDFINACYPDNLIDVETNHLIACNNLGIWTFENRCGLWKLLSIESNI